MQAILNDFSGISVSQETNLQKIARIFKLLLSGDIDDSKILNFVGALFDFKRVGDQLQVETAKQLDAIFISQDKIAIAYACLKGIPCILTISDFQYLIFFNFDNDYIKQNINLLDKELNKPKSDSHTKRVSKNRQQEGGTISKKDIILKIRENTIKLKEALILTSNFSETKLSKMCCLIEIILLWILHMYKFFDIDKLKKQDKNIIENIININEILQILEHNRTIPNYDNRPDSILHTAAFDMIATHAGGKLKKK